MKLPLQSGGWLLALVAGAGMALQCAAQNPRTNWAQNRQENKPPKEQRQQQNQQRRQEPKQERRPQQQESHRAQPEPRNSEAPRRNADASRNPAAANPPRRSGNSRDGGNRPPNAGGESVQRPNFSGMRSDSGSFRRRSSRSCARGRKSGKR